MSRLKRNYLITSFIALFCIVSVLAIATISSISSDNSSIVVVTNNGASMDSIDSDTKLADLATPEKEGYNFSGWYDNSNFAGNALMEIPKGTKALYAKYTPLEYTITYYLDEGVNNSNNPSKYTAEVTFDLKNPTKDGYFFVGWFTDSGLTTAAKTTITNSTGDLTFYAKWSLETVTISFNSNDGSAVSAISQLYNTSVAKPADPVKLGHTFAGWYKDQNFIQLFVFDENTTMPASYTMLYAKWTVNSYTISFDTNGGSLVEDITANYKSAVYAPVNEPEKEGYEFNGWYNKALTTEYTFSTMPAQNNTVYAKWNLKNYSIFYYINEGTNSSVNPSSYNMLSDIIVIQAPTKTGYSFLGWFSDDARTIAADTTIETGSTGAYFYYAKWAINSYTISFDEKGGSDVADITDIYLATVTKPADPTKTGYTFGGWYKDSEFQNAFTFTTMPAGSVTLSAKWVAIKYTISFEENGGSEVSDIVADFGTTVTKPADPTKPGYLFEGWYSDELFEISYTFGVIPASNITVYAKWKINSNVIVFNTNGGTTVDPISQDFETTVYAPADPTKTGYTFLGWYSEAELVYKVEFPIIMPAEGLNLFAKWVINPYTVTFNSNGGLFVTAITKNYNEQITISPITTQSGYTFMGWFFDSGFARECVFPYTITAENITLYAKWNTEIYTISFEENGGSVVSDITQKFGTTINPPVPDPVKTGFTFQGWYSNSAFTPESLYTFSTMPAENVTLYAYWTKNSYKITFVENEGSDVDDITAEYESTITFPEISKDGYTLEGWYTDIALTNKFTATIIPAENITLYANWVERQYTVTYNTNEGNVIAPVSDKFGTTIYSPASPKKTGHTFGGWFADVDCNEQFVFPFTMPANDTTVYAKWIVNQYTMYFVENGGSEVDNITANYKDDITSPVSIRTGYSLLGWFLDEAGTNQYTFLTMPAEGLTLYANWKQEVYTLTFVENQGTDVNEIVTVYGAAITEPVISKTGHSFDGWYEDSIFSKAFSFATTNTMPDKSFTLFAKWTKNQYTISFNENGGDEITNITGYYQDPVTQPNDPSRDYYNFRGWFADESLSTPYTFSTISADNITVYVKWETIKYTIDYYFTAEGSAVGAVNSISNKATYSVEDAFTLADPTKEGYNFDGWFTDNTYANAASTTIALGSHDALKFYAKFSIGTYTLTFDTKGGSAVSSITGVFGDTFTMPTNPSRAGYTFDKWYADAELTEEFTSTTIPESMTVYAGWNAIKYNLTYYIDNGVAETNPSFYTADNETFTLADPTRTGYTFAGWFNEEEFSTSAIITITKGTIGDKEFYAKWTINQYTLTFDSKGGSAIASITQNYDTTVTEPTAPTRTYYEFDGWYTDETYTEASKYTFGLMGESVTLFAKWKGVDYTINYFLDGGENNTENLSVYNIETETFTLGDPSKTGYRFEGWFTTSALTTLANITVEKGTTGEKTVYAKFVKNEYTITFNSNGGTDVASITQLFETAVTTPADPTKVGYKFMGWYSDTTLLTAYTITTMPGENITLYASWDFDTFTITFNTNEGSEVVSISQLYGSSVTAPAEPTRDGCTFAGWYSDEALTKAYTFGTMPAKNITIYVKWTAIVYDITYYLDGGVNNESNPATYTVLNSEFTLVAPTKTGHDFIGWYSDSTFETAADTTIEAKSTGALTFYALFEINQYTITFDVDGGEPVDSLTRDYNTDISTLVPVSIKSGYSLEWWTKGGEDFVSEYTFTTMPANNLTVYAKWTAIEYTITYVMEENAENNANNPSSYNVETTTFTFEIATKEGYTFNGWFVDEAKTIAADTTIELGSTGNITLYAKFTINKYKMTFDVDGGSEVVVIEEEFGTTITEPVSTKAGYDLQWCMKNELDELVEYTFTTMPGNDITLYAVWTIIDYDIVYHLDGAEKNEGNPLTYTVNDDTFTLGEPEKTGYIFIKWYADADFYVEATIEIIKGSTGELTFYALFEIKQYTISFEENGGSEVSVLTKDYSTDISELAPVSERLGYSLTWCSDIGLTTPYTFTTMPAEDITLYAMWTPVDYEITYNLDEGTNAEANPATYNITTATITLEAPVKAGYTFDGWFSEATFENTVTQIVLGSTGEKAVFAKYTIKTLTITFNANGGTLVDVITAEFGAEVTAPISTNAGYSLVWCSDSGLTTPYDFETNNTMPAESITVYAQWTIIDYTITYNLSDGTNGSNPETYKITTATITLADATKVGHTFDGWYSEASFETEVTQIVLGSTGNEELFAKFTVIQYTISFNADGGSEVTDIIQDFGTKVSAVESVKAGYSLKWFTESGFTNEFIFTEETTMPANNFTLFAQWTLETYTITYVLDGGTNDEANVSSYDVTISADITVNEPTKEHYTFDNWYADESFTLFASTTIAMGSTGNLTYYAKWIINKYTITFDENGGIDVDNLTADYNSKITAPSITRLGYTLVNWKKADDSVFTFTEDTVMPGENFTLTAEWSLDVYAITYNLNSGINATGNPANYTVLTPDFTIENATRQHYTFDGWYTDSNFAEGAEAETLIVLGSTGAITLYAKFTINKYTITFETNGGSEVTAITDDYAKVINPLPEDPTRAGYTFVGWCSDEELTSPYAFTGTSKIPGGNTTVYAKWTPKQYTITFVTNGGTEIDPITNYCDTLISVTDPVLADMSLEGWYLEAGFATKVTLDKIPSEDITVYAKWQGFYIYTISGEEATITGHRGNLYTDVTIPLTFEGKAVVAIAANALSNCNFTSIVIPETVTSIGANAFSGCKLMASINIPEAVLSIGAEAFANCEALTELTVPATVTSIGLGIVKNCTSLATLTAPFQNTYAVETNSYLKYYFGGTSFTSALGEVPASLKTLVINSENTSLPDYMFYNCKFIENITIPQTVTAIGTKAFFYCNSLLAIVIPDGVTALEEGAFWGCENLTTVTLPAQLSSLGAYAFYNCISLESINIPDTLTEIKNYTFYECLSLAEVTLPSSITAIGNSAFYACKALTSLVIPNSVTTVGTDILRDAISLATFTAPFLNEYNADNHSYLAYYFGGQAVLVPASLKTVTIGNNINAVANNTFLNCANIETVVIPASVLSLGSYSFSGCSSMTSIDLPSLLETVKEYAFADSGLTSITLKSNIQTVGINVFKGCNSLETMTTPFIGASATTQGSRTGVLGFMFSDIAFDGGVSVPQMYVNGTFYQYYIPSSLKNVIVTGAYQIGYGAFYNCTMLEIIDIKAATIIQERSMSFCTSLTTVTIPNTVTEIKYDSLRGILNGCSSLTTLSIPFVGQTATSFGTTLTTNTASGVLGYLFGTGSYTGGTARTQKFAGGTGDTFAGVIPNSLRTVNVTNATAIGRGAFDQCQGITEINLNEGIIWIGAAAFYNTRLVNFTIPTTVTDIGTAILSNVSTLTEITIPYVGATPTSANSANGQFGYLFGTGSYSNSYAAAGYATYYIPNALEKVTVTGNAPIGQYAFRYVSKIKEVVLANGITSIGYEAFRDCSGMTSINLPDDLNFLDGYAFYNCDGLTAIEIPAGVTVINDYTFELCDNLALVTILGDVTEIKQYAFSGCTKLNNFTIPATVTAIGIRAFQNCSSLTEVTIPEGVTIINQLAFYNCTSLTTVNFATTTNLTTIGNQAFNNCDALVSIIIPEGVTLIDYAAFYSCDKLESITLPETLLTLGNAAFRNCSSLKSLTIPNSVTLIAEGGSLLSGCSSLESLSIPYVGKDVNSNAKATGVLGHLFGAASYTNSYLVKQYYANSSVSADNYIPKALKIVTITGETDIFQFAFDNCAYITTVNITNSTQINRAAFRNCSALTTVNLPITLKNINAYAFENCTSIVGITLPANLEKIDGYAFRNCYALKTFTVPDSVTYIGMELLSGCRSIETLTVPFVARTVAEIGTYWGVLGALFDDSSYTGSYGINQYFVGNNTRPSFIPNTLKTVNVTLNNKISRGAFMNCYNLTNVNLNDEVTEIQEYAFYNCSKLTNLKLPANLVTLGQYNFYNCDAFTEITIPESVAVLSDYMFDNCNLLQKVNLPEGLQTIGAYAFRECINLSTITIPSTVASIGGYAFYNCDALKTINIPQGVTIINERTFYDCDNLLSPVFDGTSQLTTVADYAFYHCNKLNNINLPEGVTAINYRAYGYCIALQTVVLPETLLTIGNRVFEGCVAMQSFKMQGTPTTVGGLTTYGILYGCQSLVELTVPFIGQTSTSANNTSGLGKLGYYFGTNNPGATFFYNSDGHVVQYIPKTLTTVNVTGPYNVGSYAFYNCTTLTNVNLADEITYIGGYAFYGDIKVVTALPTSLTTLGEYAYYNCDALTEVTIPSGIATLNARTFYGCDKLAKVNFSHTTTNLKQINDYVFAYCPALNNVYIPQGVTFIGQQAFRRCSALTDITLPNTLLTVGQEMLYECYALTELVVPSSVTSIGSQFLGRCNNIQSLEVPFIGQNSSSNGKADGVLGWFFGANSNTNMTQLTQNFRDYVDANTAYRVTYYIPNTLTTVTLNGSFTINYGAFWDCDYIQNVYITGSQQTINKMAFFGCNNLVNVTFPATLKTINSYAFADCINLANVELPEGLLTIQNDAFRACYAMTEFTIPSTVTSVGTAILKTCRNITSLTVPYIGQNANIADSESYVLGYYFWKDSYTGSTATSQNWATYYIPNALKTVTVTGSSVIGAFAFTNCTYIETIDIKASTGIKNQAFAYCRGLKTLTIPNTATFIGTTYDQRGIIKGTNSLETLNIPYIGMNSGDTTNTAVLGYLYGFRNIGDTAITQYYNATEAVTNYMNTSLRTVNITGATTVSYGAFYGCDWITNVTIGDGVTAVGEKAFYNCSGLQSISMSATVATIGNNAFENCTAMTEASILNIDAVVGTNVFKNCNAMTTLTIPLKATYDAANNSYLRYYFGGTAYDVGAISPVLSKVTVLEGTTAIADKAFYACTSITEIVLPSTVETIGIRAFFNCISLTSITLNRTAEQGITTISPDCLLNCDGLTSIFVNADSVTAYKEDMNWCLYDTMIKAKLVD